MLSPRPPFLLPHMTDRWRRRRRQRDRRTDVMSECTFLPQLAETPVEQSQDKANEYGLDRLQYGWLEGGGWRGEERERKKSASKSTKTNMEDGAATATRGEGGRERERGWGCGLVFYTTPPSVTHSTVSTRRPSPGNSSNRCSWQHNSGVFMSKFCPSVLTTTSSLTWQQNIRDHD